MRLSASDAGISRPLLSGTFRSIKSSLAVADLLTPCCNKADGAFRLGHTPTAAVAGETQQPDGRGRKFAVARIVATPSAKKRYISDDLRCPTSITSALPIL